MTRTPIAVALVAGGLLATGAAWRAGAGRPAPAPDAASATAAVSAAAERALRERDIALYARRAAEDPESAEDRARLAALYLQRGRESGGLEDYARAEAAARASLERRRAHNAKAMLLLASSQLAQHRFGDALASAERLVAADSAPPAYRALLGEVQLELGRYDDADRTFGALRAHWRELTVAPRLARWAELRGRPAEARAILEAARDEAARRPELPREQVSWFHLRVADLALRDGRLDDATRATEAGLAVDPADVRHFALRARVAAARGRWREAVAWGARGGDDADVATMALVGDAWAALGDSARALAWWDRADRAGVERQEPFNRQWTQFRVEHGRALPVMRALLAREAIERPDLLGLTLHAMAERRAGDHAAARRAIARARRIGARDALLEREALELERRDVAQR